MRYEALLNDEVLIYVECSYCYRERWESRAFLLIHNRVK